MKASYYFIRDICATVCSGRMIINVVAIVVVVRLSSFGLSVRLLWWFGYLFVVEVLPGNALQL